MGQIQNFGKGGSEATILFWKGRGMGEAHDLCSKTFLSDECYM